jgi:hypothetical protein
MPNALFVRHYTRHFRAKVKVFFRQGRACASLCEPVFFAGKVLAKSLVGRTGCLDMPVYLLT